MNEPISSETLAQAVQQLVHGHFESPAKGQNDLHQRLLDNIHVPMLEAVMASCQFNQSTAAKKLGISRGMLRTLLIKYFDTQYCRNKKDIFE